MVSKTKLLMAVVVAGVVLFGLQYFGYMPGMSRQEAAVPVGFELPSEAPRTALPATAVALELPSTKPSTKGSTKIRVNVYPWTAMHGLMLANGGPVTTEGSLMEKAGVNVKINVQNDLEKSKGDLLRLATAMQAGATSPGEGTHFVILMGDGSAAFIGSLAPQLAKLGDDYRAEVVGAIGYSRGEDAWWGPSAWKDSSEAMKGGATAAVLRDGDWNLAQYKLANDGIKNNPDETTWDPDAMNWFSTADHLKAVELYVSGYCEDRKVVRNGKLTNETHKTCVDGVATWTPGDVNLAKQKGGLVKLMSTKENAYQMPATVIGIHAWNVRNAKAVQGFLKAAFDGGQMIRQYPDQALPKAGQAAYATYNEQTAAYWVKYYRGSRERDAQQQPVELGGSQVMNLADNLVLFGLAEGAGGVNGSIFKATYEGFGRMAKQQYPTLVPDFPSVDKAVNTSFVSALASASTDIAPAETEAAEPVTAPIAPESVVTKRNWSIQFETGSASFTPQALATLDDLYNNLAQNRLAIQLDGHTDNVGNPASNQVLSQARADAVKRYLEAKAPTLFKDRIVVRAFGQSQPVAGNDTPQGRAQNRRVTVTLGTRE